MRLHLLGQRAAVQPLKLGTQEVCGLLGHFTRLFPDIRRADRLLTCPIRART